MAYRAESSAEYAARNRCGRVARIATPTPLGVGDKLFPKVYETQVFLVIEERGGREIARAA